MQFTAVIEKSEAGWYVGQIEEVPAVLSQGRTIAELKENLADALQLLFEVNRVSIRAENLGKDVFKEMIVLPN
jgi:predicted RNase H-like HicB family nuclease